MKIILHFIKRLSPLENDEHNSSLEDQHGTEHQCSANSFQNKKLPDYNGIQPLKDKTESAINERLLTVPVKKFKA